VPAVNKPDSEPAPETIYALSSGPAPAGISVIRVSGGAAGMALDWIARGERPPPRRATLRTLIDPDNGAALDRALVLWFPGPKTVTGEDLAELHVHGGRAVVAAILRALGRVPGLRPAVAGEFTRRAFDHGRIDLIEAEALGDLLAAETEGQRRSAMILASGKLSRAVEKWRAAILMLAAEMEALIDFSDEDDVDADVGDIAMRAGALAQEIEHWLHLPHAERLRDGVRVVLAGPPNAGKSTLLNALVGRDAAIVTPIPGTTRDLIEVPVMLDGVAFLLTDTAGLRESGADEVEVIGMERAERAAYGADILLWLGPADMCPDHPNVMRIGAQSDVRDYPEATIDLALSALTGAGMVELQKALLDRAASLLPGEDESALNRRQREALGVVAAALDDLRLTPDLILMAESLRAARAALDALTGRAGTEDMFDTLFGAFCIGK
jgi:tRNA modification GTPase